MRIGIDISQIVYETGVSTYTRNLVKSLLKIDHLNGYVLFGGSLRRSKDIKNVFPQAKTFPIPPMFADILWNRLHILPIEKLIGKLDVLHTSDWSEPPAHAFKVTTVHDLYPFKFPRLVSPLVREVHKRRLFWVLSESQRIIVPSESTKHDLISVGGNEQIIRVIPEAPTLSRPVEGAMEEVKRMYRLHDEYLIAIGVTQLKNTQRIIRAFHLAKPGKNLKLVLVGSPVGIKIEEQRDVRILGHVSKENLAALLSGSKGLVFASLYEGFGIPILDAFNCGVPVVTSNTGSMPEVAGGAAVLVDPQDVDSVKTGIEKIVNGPKGFIEKGLKRVGDFSWERTARMTLDVYNESK